MTEALVLPPLPRETVAPLAARLSRLASALPQIEAVIAGETDAVALMATLARLLWEALPQASFVGFYRRVADAELAVGPYQGPLGCLRIPFARGVCGACARSGRAIIVPDVTVYPGHIACDPHTRSEIVLPVFAHGGELVAVLDLDAPAPAAFDAAEGDLLQALLERVFTGNPAVQYGR